MILESIKEVLKSARTQLGAASCTFYVRDPFWHDELRLIAMPGVQLTEPMHGFSFPPHSKRVLAEGGPEIFSPDARSDEQLREEASAPLDGIAPDRRFLFGDFIEREGIKSSARLWYEEDNHLEAVLFVNYTDARKFDDQVKNNIRNLLRQLVENLPALHDELRASEMNALVQAIRIFPPTHAGSATRLNEWDQPLDEYLSSLLGLAIEALDLNADTTLGTVHLYDRQTKTLRLMAHYGTIEDFDKAREPLSIPTGQGIVSWVAIRRKAVLIADLESSGFKEIHIAIKEGVRSEIAIPIFAGKDLLGILNLESLLPNAFPRTCVRSLWFAVNRAAVAYRMWQQININERLTNLISGLLDLCGEAVNEGTGDFSLDRLADLAAKELQAARCGIWHYDAQHAKFELAGISPQGFEPDPPRSIGWSNLVRKLGWSVWLDKEETGVDFRIRYWNGKDWDQPPPDLGAPGAMNPGVKLGVRSLLGIPISVRGQCIGIAWLEYESSPEIHTENELMKLASGFAAYAGLVIEFSQVDLVDKDAVQGIGDQLSEHLLSSGRLRLERFPKIEGYVISRPFPYSRIGGDFYAARVIDEQTACVLVGDGRGHAVTGALNMLPMLTVFEAFWKESRSATHIMDKIMGISNKLGVQGTGVYCVFTLIQKSLWLSVTSSAHPFLVVIPESGGALPFPDKESPAMGGMLGVPMLTSPLAEDRRRLFSGDIIIICTDGLDMDIDEMSAIGLEHKREDPKVIADAVFSRALHKHGKPLDDDATVLVIRVK
jgi:GAF domain-containing protein